MARLNPDIFRLYLVTDQTLMHGDSLIDVVSSAVKGGVTCVQLREKNLDTCSFLSKALTLKALLGYIWGKATCRQKLRGHCCLLMFSSAGLWKQWKR